MAIPAPNSRKLRAIFNDPSDPGSFGGVERLWRSAQEKDETRGVSRDQVREFLKSEEAYSLHKPIRRHFLRNRTVVNGIDDQWQADLADISQIAKENAGYRYLLTVIDCFSKFAWAIPVRRKDAIAITEAFATLLNVSKPRKPNKLQTDKGKEFLNAQVQSLFKKHNIKHFVTHNEPKASIVERFNRTLKTRIFTYLSANNTNKYIDILPQVLDSYNHSVHRTIGTRPVDVTKNNEEDIWFRIYGKDAAKFGANNGIIKPGITVRISKAKAIFDKGYLPNWTRELFKVAQDTRSSPTRPLMKLKDRLDEDIGGRFYPNEIQVVTDSGIQKIEKVLKKRKTAKGGKEMLVKWLGWPSKFNSWVTEDELQHL